MTTLKETPTQFAERFEARLFGKESLTEQFGDVKTTEYSGGTVDYSVLGPDQSTHHKIMVINGFTEDRITGREFAEALTEGRERTVLIADQPSYKNGVDLSAIDHQAEAYLALIVAEGLGHEPLDVVAHSMGAPILIRMAELAKQRGLTCLDIENGSKSVFLAPVGANEDEKLRYLTGRFVGKFAPQAKKETKKFDPSRLKEKTSMKNATKNLPKTLKEVVYISRKQQLFAKLGEVSLNPLIVEYANDPLMPGKNNKALQENFTGVADGEYVDEGNGYNIAGWVSVIDNTGVGARNFDEFKQNLETSMRGKGELGEDEGLTKQEAKDKWMEHYRNAGHNDHSFNPERSARIVLNYFNSK